MTRPLAIDLFCGAGGAGMGLWRAGFDVVGVDIKLQPRYPFDFVQGDALKPPVDLARAAFIWASPPCQRFSAATSKDEREKHPDLVDATRQLLARSSALTCIENVPRAPLRRDLLLDGSMFPELRVVRERWFELNFFCLRPASARWRGMTERGDYVIVVGHGTSTGRRQALKFGRRHVPLARWKAAMGIDWMTRPEITQAIPPAYSEFIGRAALAWLKAAEIAA